MLDYATKEGRTVLTFNRLHFMRLHRSTVGEHGGIIICTMDHDTDALALRIHEIIRDAGDLKGQLLRVNRPV